MSAEQALFKAYREWQRLAKAEHQAIQKRDWGFLLKCQCAVRRIQPSVSSLREQVRQEWGHGHADCVVKQNELNSIIAELMKTVKSNKTLIESARSLALAEREKLVHAARNLKRLRNSYEITRASRWSSFS